MNSENTAFKRFMKVVDKAEDICLVVMFALMVIFIFLQIIMRFVVGHSLVWSEELGKFIFVWLSWLGISIGERRNEHIKITLVTDMSEMAKSLRDSGIPDTSGYTGSHYLLRSYTCSIPVEGKIRRNKDQHLMGLSFPGSRLRVYGIESNCGIIQRHQSADQKGLRCSVTPQYRFPDRSGRRGL